MKNAKSLLMGYLYRAVIMALTFYFPFSQLLIGLATGEWIRHVITCFIYFYKQNKRIENRINRLINQ